MIKDALSVLPTRPVVYIAPLIVVVVMSFYYWDRYSKCAAIKQYRNSLTELLRRNEADAQFRLTDSTDFGWDAVRIVEKFNPEQQAVECPFGWNWPDGVRQDLVASGLLTVLIFFNQGAIVGYFELRDDEVAIRGVEASLTPDNAVFSIGANPTTNDGVSLRLKQN